MSLNDFSISKSRDTEFFRHVLPLKNNDSTSMLETIPMHDNVPLSTSSSDVRNSVVEPRRSKRPRVETSFGPTSLSIF